MKTEMNTEHPKSKGWALTFVKGELPIPESWRNGFYDELISDDSQYRKELEMALKTHGVRFTK